MKRHAPHSRRKCASADLTRVSSSLSPAPVSGDAGTTATAPEISLWEIAIPPSIRAAADWLGDQIAAAAAQNDFPALLRFTRDRAFVLLNYFCITDLVEVSRLRRTDIALDAAAMTIVLGGQRRALPSNTSRFCPVAALRIWLSLSEIRDGPIFRRVKGNHQLSAEPLSPGELKNIFRQSTLLAKTGD